MTNKIYGNIHSIESFGTVDGPGIRMVVFMQGCPMRCLYCHNPDTWAYNKNKSMSIEEILQKYESIKEFLKNGGITVTGGEPLSQIEFVTELFKKAKEKNIHTALDTSGVLFNPNKTDKIDKLLKYTDLVMLDIKHIDDEEHKKLTSYSNKNILEFAKYLSGKEIDTWIRHVVVPGITDDPVYLEQLGYFIGAFTNLKALDILPYHDMGTVKYEKLGMEYKLKDVPPMEKSRVPELKKFVLDGIKKRRLELGM